MTTAAVAAVTTVVAESEACGFGQDLLLTRRQRQRRVLDGGTDDTDRTGERASDVTNK